MCIATPTQAHDCNVEAIVGAEDLPIALGGGTDRQTRRPHRKGVEKFTPAKHFVSPSNQPKSVLFKFRLGRKRMFDSVALPEVGTECLVPLPIDMCCLNVVPQFADCFVLAASQTLSATCTITAPEFLALGIFLSPSRHQVYTKGALSSGRRGSRSRGSPERVNEFETGGVRV